MLHIEALSAILLLIGLIKSCQTLNFEGSRTTFGKFTAWTPCQNGSITLDFKTKLANALIFYTHFEETKDYFELDLVDGIMQLHFKIQGKRDRLSAGSNLNDNEWHEVKVMRDGRLTILTVDTITYTREYKGYDPNKEMVYSSDENFVYIGGLPMSFNDRLSELPLTQALFHQRLRGSVRNLFYSNCGQALVPAEMLESDGIILDDDECLHTNPCHHGGICVMRDSGVQCDCSWTDHTGEYCEQDPRNEKQPMEASFYGTQYLMYDLSKRGDPIFSENDKLSLHFKTTHMDGLLFYTGENRDYMTVTLKNGMINVAINLGSGLFSKVVDMNGFKLDDGQWHHVEVTRNSRKILISIDGLERASGTTMGDFNMLSSNLLYVAGSPNPSEIDGSHVRVNFRGCMKKVEYQADNINLDLTELAYQDHDLISVIGDVVFQKCEEVVDPEPVTFTTSASFIALPHWDLSSNVGTISFMFRTTEDNGLLMYNSGSYETDHLDFFALEIIDGYLYLVLDLGARAIKEKASRSVINDGLPRTVYLQYNGQTGYIRVDSHQTPYSVTGTQTKLNLVPLLYIGGLDFKRHNPYRLPKELWSGTLQHGFVGCLQDLMINNNKMDLMTIAKKQNQKNINGECQVSGPQCQSRPCMHNGVCSEGWNRYVCDCRATGYSGNICENAAPTLTFDGAQYMLITLPQESVTEVEDISLRFKTIHSSGILLMSTSTSSDDSIELFLERGACKLTISLGTGSKTLSIGLALNDDSWHTVFVKRRGQDLELKVDNERPVNDIIPQVATSLKISQIVLGSVGPMLSDVAAISSSLLVIDDPGVGIQNDDSIVHHSGFVGSLQQFSFNGNRYFEIAEREHVENVEITARCQTLRTIASNIHGKWKLTIGLPSMTKEIDKGYPHQFPLPQMTYPMLLFESTESVTRDPVTFESRKSYVILPKLHANKHFALYFKFKTIENTGLILFSGKSGHDFLALELYQGYLYYIYDMGAGTQRIRVNTPEALNDDKWHDVSLLRPQTDQQQIRVDSNSPTVEDMTGSSAKRFDLEGPLFLGGIINTRYISLPGQIYSRHGYLGCIASLDINGYQMNILHSANSVEGSVGSGCSSSELTCHASSCFNGGKCVPSRNSYVCDCDLTSYTGSTCTEESTTYEFGLDRGLIVFEHPENARMGTNSDYLAFGFKTNQDFAVLARVDSADNDDFIEVELSGGNIFVVYNMGQANIPIGESFRKVNDGKYHVLKFVRSGANASLQVDNWDRYTKTPKGKQMTIFNQQARVWVGGRMNSNQQINNAFHGTVSGLVFNGLRILDLLKEGDPRVKSVGDVSLLENQRDVDSMFSLVGHPNNVEDTDIQATQGTKRKKRNTAFANSTKRKSNTTTDSPGPKYFLQFDNLIDPDIDINDIVQGNEIIEKSQPVKAVIKGNIAQKPFVISDKGTQIPSSTNIPTETDKDVLIGGKLDSMATSGDKEIPFENDDTDWEDSGFSDLTGSGDGIGYELSQYSQKHDGHGQNKGLSWNIRLALFPKFGTKDGHAQNDRVEVGKLEREPFARDDRYSQYPKDRGKYKDVGDSNRSKTISENSPSSNIHSKLHSTGTTPSKTTPDDSIIHSGLGPCFSDDEDECVTTSMGTSDDIITPNIVITRQSTPSPPVKPSFPISTNDTVPCKDCKPESTGIDPASKDPSDKSDPTSDIPRTTQVSMEAREDKNANQLNIFLIIAIVAGVVLALVILFIAFYKFRSREEGSYRVDESQNFAYLEAKKQQTNGSAINNVGNGKAGGKKKDVKEWYV